MHIVVSAPVRWPGRDRIDAAWATALTELAEIVVDHQGVLTMPGEPLTNERVRLVRGTHLAPGAAYTVESPELDGVGVGIAVGGTDRRRTLRAHLDRQRMLGMGHREAVVVTLDGLDRFESLEATSSHPYLKGLLTIRPDPDDPWRMDLALRWLRVRLDLTVTDAPISDVAVPATASEPALPHELRLRLRVSSRGLWSPLTASLLAIAGRFADEGLQDTVNDWAASLTTIAEGRESPLKVEQRDRAEKLANAEWAKGQIRYRIESVNQQSEPLGWWANRSWSWMRRYRDLPALSWPERDALYPSYAQECESIAKTVARAPRRARQARLDEELAGFSPEVLLFEERVHELSAEATATPSRPLRAEDLELAWLRSPRTLWTYLRQHNIIDEPPPPGVDE